MEDSFSEASLNDNVHLIPINVGTLAVIILSVVTTCTPLTVLSLYCWRRWSSQTNVTCSRCHQIIAVQGAMKPRQIVQQYFVVQPQSQPLQPQHTFIQPPPNIPGQATASLAGLPGSRQHQQYRQQGVGRSHQYENVPEIVIDHPDPATVTCGDSATFQRLGMREQRQSQVTQVSNEARALETQALSLVQSSPPDQASPGLEPLTPSPVISPQLGQVKQLNFPAHQTPCANTPANAIKRRRSALKQPGRSGGSSGKRTVTVIQPFRQGEEVGNIPELEVSDMAGSNITTGDLVNLVDSVQESLLGDRNHSNSTNDTKTITPGSVFSSNIDTPEIMKMAEGYKEQDRRRRQEEEEQSFATSSVTPEPALAKPDHISNRREETSPYLAIASHQEKVSMRGTESSPNIAISGHDQHVTSRTSVLPEDDQSSNPNHFMFGEMNLSSPMVLENVPTKNTYTITPSPSKIPTRQAYLSKTPSKENGEEGEKTPGSSGKKLSASKIPRLDSGKKLEKKERKLPPRSQKPTNYEENLQRTNQDKGLERPQYLQNSLKLVHTNQSRS